ncbi:hypothetical protein L1049_021515 [Liquidambar formosana]|uniref:Uncharacterized protein n=1 Tax=Liquidambar formosana TaxID=63359 RepID=A0AAP0N426_LIQFO
MAVFSLCENDNKENIPPFSLRQATAVQTISTASTRNKRGERKPLEDITNLFYPSIDSCSVPNGRPSTLSCHYMVCEVKRRKRRAEGSETRPVNSFVGSRALLEGAKEAYNFGLGNEDTKKHQYELERLSPGGPDPQHH